MTQLVEVIKSHHNLLKEIVFLFAGLIGGFFSSVFTEPVRKHFFKADLSINFSDSPDYRVIPSAFRRLIRIKVENKKDIAAENCQVYLNNIEKADSNKEFQKTVYCDSFPLGWAYKEDKERYSGLTLNKGVNQFLNVFTVTQHWSHWTPETQFTPAKYDPLFQENGIFRLTIQVTASNADPKIFKMILEWIGDWNNFKVYKG